MGWEVFGVENILMQILSQKITTIRSTMPIINRKKRRLNPILHNIQNNTNPILVILPRDTLIRINSISLNITIFLTTYFGRVEDVFVGSGAVGVGGGYCCWGGRGVGGGGAVVGVGVGGGGGGGGGGWGLLELFYCLFFGF